MESFSIEFDHTDAQISEYASRCGCPKCERFRRATPAPTPAQPTIVNRPGERPVSVERVQLTPTSAPVEVQRVVSFCSCHPATRGLAQRGVCSTCGRQRDPQERARRAAAAPATTSSQSQQVAQSLGVQTSLAPNAQRGTAEIVSPREQALREMQGLLDSGLMPTRRQVEKWSSLIRSITTTTTGTVDGHLTHRDVVAGAHTAASGKFFGFAGLGQLTRAQLAAVLAEAQCPAEWLPAAKSAHAQAGRVVGNLSRLGYVVRAARVPTGTKAKAEKKRDWKARWTVGVGNGTANVGDAFGRTVLTVTLLDGDSKSKGGTLKIEGEEQLAIRVRADFDSLCAGDVYAAADVSSWLYGIFYAQWRAAHIGGNLYVRRRFCAQAEALCGVLSKVWGRRWMLPAIPMATCEELCRGMLDGFAQEADAVLSTYREELEAARAEARAAGKIGQDTFLGTKRATTLLGEIRALTERAVGYHAMFGDRLMMELREKLVAAAEEISESVDDISQRFSLIFDELRREAERHGDR